MAFDPRTTHPKYDEFAPSWKLMRDAVDGEDTIKRQGEVYLPIKSGTATISDPAIRKRAYDAYKLRAEFPELVSPTIRGSVGVILEQEPEIVLPSQLETLRERATRDGQTLQSVFRRICMEIMTTGRYGVLPGLTPGGDPYLATYVTEAIVNWDSNDEGQDDYVMLDESRLKFDRESGKWTPWYQYRQLYVEDGVYTSRLWTSTDGTNWSAGMVETATRPPRNGVFEGYGEMPFVFINTNDLRSEPDDVPLYGLAKLSVRVYRLDADYTFALHMTSEPTPWVNGFADPKSAIEDGSAPNSLGSSKLWVLGEGAQAGFLEFTGPGLAAQATAIESSLKRAVLFGANLLSDGQKSAESGDALKLRLGSQTSTLKTIAQTAAAGLERALKNLAVWLNVDPNTVEVNPNTDFFDQTLSAQDITALVAGWQAEAYSKPTLHERLKKGGIVPTERTFEEEEELIAANPPALPEPPAVDTGTDNTGASEDEE